MRTVLTAVLVASSIAIAAAQGQQPAAPGQPPSGQGQPPTAAPPSPQPAPRTPQVPAPAAAGQQAANKITIGGCIQNAPAPAGEPAAGAAAAASKFELASAKVVSGAPVGTSGAAPTAMRYRLEGDEKTITPHLNHQVEITGTVSPATAAGAAAAPMLKVESVKMIAAKCS